MTNIPYQRKDIDGFPGYQVDTEGNVFSCRTNGGKILKDTWHTLKPVRPNKKYNSVVLCSGGKMKSIRINRLMAITFIKNPFNKPLVCHNDSNPLNNNIKNLRWCTQKENIADAIKHGSYVHGESHGRHKLSNLSIQMIKHLISLGESSRQIALLLNMHPTTIQRIVKGRIWKHI